MERLTDCGEQHDVCGHERDNYRKPDPSRIANLLEGQEERKSDLERRQEHDSNEEHESQCLLRVVAHHVHDRSRAGFCKS
jgi:hypothetical protein